MTSTISKSIDQLAFNVSLVAYDHGLDLKDLPAGHRLGFRDIKRNKKLVELKESDYTCPPVEPTPQELSIDQSENVGIWVGMWPPVTVQELEGHKTKGQSIKSLALKGGYSIIDTNPKALRVVVPMNKETASYYALVDQDDTGLCSGLSLPITDVFFFPQYRKDELTDTAKRKSEWSDLVRQVCNPVEKVIFAKNYDKTKFQVPLKRSLANELSSLVGTYIEGGDSSVLTTAINLIDHFDTDGAFTPAPRNNALAQLAESTTKMSAEECGAALSELLTLAPDLKVLNISSQDLQRVNTGLVDTKSCLPYAHLRAFIVQFMHELAGNDGEELDLNDTVVRCASHVRLQLGGKPAFKERQGQLDGLGLILEGQMNKMEDIRRYVRVSVAALKDSQGDNAIATAPTLPQIWTKYGVSPDLDSAKLYAAGVHRHNVDALGQILAVIEMLLSQNCKHLKELKSSIPPVEPMEVGGGAQGEGEGEDEDEGVA